MGKDLWGLGGGQAGEVWSIESALPFFDDQNADKYVVQVSELYDSVCHTFGQGSGGLMMADEIRRPA